MNYELMDLYSIYPPPISHIDIKTELGTILDKVFHHTILWKLRGNEIDIIFDSDNVMDEVVRLHLVWISSHLGIKPIYYPPFSNLP